MQLDVFRLYLDEIGRHPLLTKDDEIALSRAYHDGLRAGAETAALPAGDPRRPALERAAARRSKSSTGAWASSSPPTRPGGSDRRSPGARPSGARGRSECRSTSASGWAACAQSGLRESLGREPTDDELGRDSTSTLRVARLRDASRAIESLDSPVGTMGRSSETSSRTGRRPGELAARAVGQEALEQALTTLPERERRVLALRFGLDSGSSRTLEEIGRRSAAPGRARQVERDALAALRRPEDRARLGDLVAS